MNAPSGPELEKLIGALARARGGVAYKFTSPGRRGVPDRLIVLPGGRVAFVEAKGRGDRVRPSQGREVVRLIGLGVSVRIVSSFAEVRQIFDTLDSTIGMPTPRRFVEAARRRFSYPHTKDNACPRRP